VPPACTCSPAARSARQKSESTSLTQHAAEALTWCYMNRPQTRPRQALPVAAKISNQPRDLRFPGAIAQLEEHLLCKQGVRGSSPLSSTTAEVQLEAHFTVM
jgi:hypothetical protein